MYIADLYLPFWLDAVLIAPFRLPADPYFGIWLGCAVLSLYAAVLGEATAGLLFWANRRYYTKLQDAVHERHNRSVEALHAGNKDAFTAINKEANTAFGKAFFAQATVGMASLWPVPFCLAWLALRFEGQAMYRIPFTDKTAGYVFVFLTCYIAARIAFAKIKKSLPGFSHIHRYRLDAHNRRPPKRPFLPSGSSSETD